MISSSVVWYSRISDDFIAAPFGIPVNQIMIGEVIPCLESHLSLIQRLMLLRLVYLEEREYLN
jgi:hypothetical protein